MSIVKNWNATGSGVDGVQSVAVSDTNSVDLSVSGTDNVTISADVKISADEGNIIQINTDGLFVPENNGIISVSGTDTSSVNINVSNSSGLVDVSASVIVSGNAGNSLQSLSSGLFVPAIPSTTVAVYEYATPGSYVWNRPLNCIAIDLFIVSGGGGGGAGRSRSGTDGGGGSGGAGGCFFLLRLIKPSVPESAGVVVGSGGNGGLNVPGSPGNPGNTGTASSFGAFSPPPGLFGPANGSGAASPGLNYNIINSYVAAGGSTPGSDAASPTMLGCTAGGSGSQAPSNGWRGGGSPTSMNALQSIAGALGGTSPGGRGQDGGSFFGLGLGGGGGAGASLGQGPGGDGGNGGFPGGGGGGGGGSRDGDPAGNGGKGGDGYVLVIAYIAS